MRIAWILLSACLAAFSAHAEIEKIAIPGNVGLDLFWWPKIAPAAGWHQDEKYSFHYSAKCFAPDGFTFEDAEAVIYAKAAFKPRLPKIGSLDEYIANDHTAVLESNPDVSIREEVPLSTASDRKLRSFTFFPRHEGGNWERVSYGEEGEFYLLFVISARSLAGYEAAVADYKRFIAGYRE
jgi:hypothetical protein